MITRDNGRIELRWWILLMLFLAITINVLDRQVLSLVAPVLRDQLHLSNTAYGAIIFFFLFGMTVGQLPVGHLLDRYGPRLGFPCLILFWSIANMLHGMARTVAQFGALRFVLGLNECGTYSGGVKVIGEWFPVEERALASGVFNSGSLVGAIAAPPIIVWIMTRYGWPAAFLIPGFVGVGWIVPWLMLYRAPAVLPVRANSAAADVGEVADPDLAQPSLRRLLRLSPVWGVILMRAFGGPVTHFYWYWLPEYLKHDRGLSLAAIGMLAWLPFLFGGLGNVGGGWLSSALIRRGCSVDRSRRSVIMGGVALCLLAVLVPLVRSTAAAIALICIASAGINAIAAVQIGILTDLFPSHILARISGLTGVGDGLVSMVMMFATGVVVDHFSYLPIFIAAAILPLLLFASLVVLVGPIRRLPTATLLGSSVATPVPA